MSNIKSNQYILFSERNTRYIRMKMFINPKQVYLYCDVVDFRSVIKAKINSKYSIVIKRMSLCGTNGLKKLKWSGYVNEHSFELTLFSLLAETCTLRWSGYSVQRHQTLVYQSAL